MYRNPRLAAASRPGSNALTPADSAFSMSSAPVTRSSVAPSGRSTTGVASEWLGGAPTSPKRAAQSSHQLSRESGSQWKRQPSTTSIGGSSAASPRIAVVLPVPRSPSTSTPPIEASTAASSSASFMSA